MLGFAASGELRADTDQPRLGFDLGLHPCRGLSRTTLRPGRFRNGGSHQGQSQCC
jgi:hypothetical protein